MFRLQDNVPNNYIDNSRDFQLFIRILDCLQNATKFDIDTMIYLFDPMRVNSKILDLLCSKVGFYPKRDIDVNTLRYIIAAFPYLIKYKGSIKGVEAAVATILNASNTYIRHSISIRNTEIIKDAKNNEQRVPVYSIEISIMGAYDKIALNELLDYIVPIGYKYKTASAESRIFTTDLDYVDIIKTYKDPILDVSQVVNITNNFNLPIYSIDSEEIEPSEVGEPGRVITTDNDDNDGKGKYTQTVYTYYEVENEKTYKKTAVMKVYDVDNNRYIGTIDRIEVVGESSKEGE